MSGVLQVMRSLILTLSLILISPIYAHDEGQWGNQDPGVREWYQGLMRPDFPTSSCCGEADAYWCDTIHVRDGHTFCTITDDRPDEPLRRPHIDVGTVIEIPDVKLKWDRANPTGHAIVFLARGWAFNSLSTPYVFCFVQGTGI